MGSHESSPFWAQLESYNITETDVPNEITYLQAKDNKQRILIRSMNFNDKDIYEKFMEKHNCSLQRKDNNNTQRLIKFENRIQEDYCSTNFQIFGMWEHFPRTLEEQMRDRSIRDKFYTEQELGRLIQGMVRGLRQLQKQSIIHQKLKSQNLKLDQRNQIKITDPLSLGCLSNTDRVSTAKETDLIYLSPEQCEALSMGTSCLKTHKNDVWTLGMIILEIGLLTDMNSCYREDCRRVQFSKIAENIGKFSKKYPNYETLLKDMLRKNKSERLDCLQLTKKYFPAAKRQQRISPQVMNYGNSKKLSYGIHPTIHYSKDMSTPTFGKGYLPPPHSSTIGKPPQLVNNVLLPQDYYNTNKNGLLYPNSQYNTFNTYQQQQLQQQQQGPPTFRLLNRQTQVPSFHTQIPSRPQLHPSIIPVANSILMYPPTSSHTHTTTINPTPIVIPRSFTHTQYKPPTFQYNPLKTDLFSQNNNQNSINNTNKSVEKLQNRNNVMIESAGFHKILSQGKKFQFQEGSQLKKFVSPASSQGFLFANMNSKSANKYQQQASRQKQPEKQPATQYKPLNLLILNSSIQKQQSLSKENKQIQPQSSKKLESLKDTYIKNAESITYESDRIQNNLGLREVRKQYEQQQQQQQPNTLLNMKEQKLVSHEDQAERDDQENEEDELQYVIETFKQGSRYQGYKLQDMRHGEGKFYYQDGGMYDGNWERNKMHGFGRLYYQNGNLAYEGNWDQDKFHGKGKLINDNPDILHTPYDYRNFQNIQVYWEFYQGDFVQDFKQGRGKLQLSNKEYFVGCFHNDMIEGRGKFHTMGGQVIKGRWEQNRLVQMENQDQYSRK